MFKKVMSLMLLCVALVPTVSYAKTKNVGEICDVVVPYTLKYKDLWNKNFDKTIPVGSNGIKGNNPSGVGIKLVFKPVESGYYSILTRGDADTYIDHFDTRNQRLISSDNGGHNKNGLMYMYCEGGREYKFILRSRNKESFTYEISRGLPTSGYELSNWGKYVSEDYRLTNNCYTYMLGMYQNVDGTMFRDNGQNPGEMGGANFHSSWFDSTSIVNTLILDRVGTVDKIDIKPINEWEMASEGYYKVALVMKKDYDIHWYRQNPDGTWSHKAGTSPVRFTDYSNKVIFNPRQSDTGVYDEFVGYYQVKNTAM